MSLVISEPTSLVAVNDQCEMVERWAETCDSIPQLQDASNKLAAISEYLHRTSIEGRGRVAATMRRLDFRISQLIGPSRGPGRPSGNSNHDLNLPSHIGTQLRQMAGHGDLIEALAAQSTDEHPVSRRQVLQAIADVERELAEKRAIDAEVREVHAKFRPDGFDPEADAELTRQRGALMRLCRDLTELGDPQQFVREHSAYAARLKQILPTADAARQWLESFVAAAGGES